ncbi:NTP transferase domain-containing protein [Fodinicurvata fenggangensis]|uniref:NTP transferase domain-containing protein n=1 Tax=Fodinicurvata fenggangensis TaxID=1121830 RepID=UPI00047DE737|nr:molybdopterin-binding/glycosyltransferase family 2 protein [Fodinicurvata fenggangensis]
MIFGQIPIDQAEGALLAHSLKRGSVNFKKGRQLSAEDIQVLRLARIEEVTVAQIEDGDIHEDDAAQALASSVAGSGTELTSAVTGRCNIMSTCHGLLVVDSETINTVNRVDEALTVATLPAYEMVEPRQMLATVKIIPFAAPRHSLQSCQDLCRKATAAPVRIAPFQRKKVGLIQTSLAGMKESLLDKTQSALNHRLRQLGSPDVREIRCAHDEGEVAAAISRLTAEKPDILLVSGASAIIDRKDTIPAAIEQAGGQVRHFGMPVDPGNLLLLAEIGGIDVIGLPGCARSPKLNGFDWVLQRLCADLPIAPEDIAGMGVGGLLKEIPSRPLPRTQAVSQEETAQFPRVTALVLAAGQSRRMGHINKLLEQVNGKSLLQTTVDTALDSQVSDCLVVTGHESDKVQEKLDGKAVRFIHNPKYADGLSTSIQAGLAALEDNTDAILVMLADMPEVSSEVLNHLVTSYNPVEGREICVPTWQGKRGNPVLIGKEFFAEIMEISGDIGARQLLGDYPDLVAEVAVKDDSVLADIDAPQDLEALRKRTRGE